MLRGHAMLSPRSLTRVRGRAGDAVTAWPVPG